MTADQSLHFSTYAYSYATNYTSFLVYYPSNAAYRTICLSSSILLHFFQLVLSHFTISIYLVAIVEGFTCGQFADYLESCSSFFDEESESYNFIDRY